ncbi:geranylgeranyl reductase family protein [Caminibacter pacificus]
MKILIIGGGPAGATAARLLAKEFDVTLIQDRVWDKPCGGGVKKRVFEEFSLDNSLILHLQDRVFMVYKNEKIEIPLKGDNLAIVRRLDFDAYLRNEAQKEGAKLIYGKFKGIENKKAVIEINKEKVIFEYDILIGADGVNSTLRKALNLPPIPKTITHYARTTEYKTKYCEFFFDKELGGEYYAWAFPHGDLTHIGSVDKNSFDNLCKYLNVKVKPKGYFIPTWQEDIIIQKENVFFVGDAAGQVVPLSFEGIYYAIKSAEILANSIKNNLNYQEEWNKKYLNHFKFMKRLESINKTFLRGTMIKLHKFDFMKNFSIDLWLRG